MSRVPGEGPAAGAAPSGSAGAVGRTDRGRHTMSTTELSTTELTTTGTEPGPPAPTPDGVGRQSSDPTRLVPTRRISFEESLQDLPRYFATGGDLVSSHLAASLSALFPDEFEDSELGEVPLNWPIEELGAQLDVLETGRRPKGGVGSFLEGVPSVGAESILGVGLFDYEKTKYITEDFFVSMRSGRAESMDVMLYKDGGKPGDFRPRVSMFGRKFPFERFAINEHIFRIRSKILGQAFLYLQLSHERILNDLHNRGGKAAIPGINQAEVKTLRLPIPPREALSRFNEIVTPMMESILDRAVQSRTLASLRDTLLPKLISGELRIEDAEKFVEASGA